MSKLETYREKRDFEKTAEPEGKQRQRRARKKSGPGGVFVIHKHAARQLHYDLRLEMDGVLKSWAVPKGPSMDPAVRRLAVHVEDHPLEYGAFEGVIPKGEYGGGTVMLWDAGRWEPIGDADAGYRRGDLKFRLAGERLHGAWVLVRMATRRQPGEGDGEGVDAGKDWLLIKERDEDAEPGAADPWGDRDRSVTSRRTMEEIAGAVAPETWHSSKPGRPAIAGRPAVGHRPAPAPRQRNSGLSAPLPDKVPVTLATLVDEPPEGEAWMHEIKFDGYRILTRVSEGDVTLLTRNGIDWTARFPTLAAELKQLEIDGALLDGEVVAYGPDGISDFGGLQKALSEHDDTKLTYMVFDLLYAGGEDLRPLPFAERKARLDDLLSAGRRGASGLIRVSEHVAGHGASFYAEACRLGLEGVVSKRADGSYPGRRSRTWLKSKCGHRQEFVVGGYTDPSGSRPGFGALLLGVHEAAGDLRYAGKVGSGFSDAVLTRLAKRLRALARASSPFDGVVKERAAHWVTPKLVAEVAFSGWTTDGRLRHPVFKGVREDKAASAVRRETAPGHARRVAAATSHAKPDAAPRSAAAGNPAPDGTGKSKSPVSVAGVRISHPERVVYPDVGMTKLEVVTYYEAVAERMLPHLTGRPLTVVRCPEGAAEECFFQKHAMDSIPALVPRVTVKEGHGSMTYAAITTAEALLTMVQLGALEFHIWGSREDHLETPDRIVFDLDPAPDVRWTDVRAGAVRLREHLTDRGLQSLLMTSGGKGLHVVVTLRPEAGWDAVKDFSRAVVEDLVRLYPGKYVATMSKAKRPGKVFIDHFRNGRGATAITPYSLRARDGAPVATPLAWEELGRTAGGGVWTARRLLRRLRSQPDPWAGADQLSRQRLPETYR